MTWVAADMTNAKGVYPEGGIFEAVIDKATFDALMCTDEASHVTHAPLHLAAVLHTALLCALASPRQDASIGCTAAVGLLQKMITLTHAQTARVGWGVPPA